MSSSTGGNLRIINATNKHWRRTDLQGWDISQEIPENIPVGTNQTYHYEFNSSDAQGTAAYLFTDTEQSFQIHAVGNQGIWIEIKCLGQFKFSNRKNEEIIRVGFIENGCVGFVISGTYPDFQIFTF